MIEESELETAWLCPSCEALYMPDDDYSEFYCYNCSDVDCSAEDFPYALRNWDCTDRRLQACVKVQTADSGDSVYIPGEEDDE